jgi:NAD(P)-dependent dehydrogenase (short-subunit alcohol dehydrogenase family)
MKIQDVLYYVTGGSSGLGLATVTELINVTTYNLPYLPVIGLC